MSSNHILVKNSAVAFSEDLLVVNPKHEFVSVSAEPVCGCASMSLDKALMPPLSISHWQISAEPDLLERRPNGRAYLVVTCSTPTQSWKETILVELNK